MSVQLERESGLSAKRLAYVVDTVDRWIEWYRQGGESGGYPSMSPYARLTPRSNSFKSVEPDVEEVLLAVDKCIAAMDPLPRIAIQQQHITVNATAVQRARRCRCGIVKYYQILGAAYFEISKAISH